MQNLVLLIFVEVIASIQASKPRSVNVALETVLEFDSKDDVQFIDTMQNFLKKLKTTITKNRATHGRDNQNSENGKGDTKKLIFTDFLVETINVLKSYTDAELKNFFNTLNREIKSWQSRKEFHETSDKLGLAKLINRNLESLENSPAHEIRSKLNSLSNSLQLANVNGNNGFVGDFLNYFYKKESEANLVNFLNNLKLYRSRRNNMTDMKRMIRNGILTFIEPLIQLNYNTISDLNRMYHKFSRNNTDTKHVKDFLEHIKIYNSKRKISRQKHKNAKALKGNEILDYIEDHIRVIDSHLTTKGFKIKAKIKSLQKNFKTTGTTYKYIGTTRRNIKHGGSGKLVKNKHSIKAKRKNISAVDGQGDRSPVLIKLSRISNPELKSIEEYLYSTPKRQRRYKKSTRRNVTPKKTSNYLRSTKKFRKAFRTTTPSAEGLSIEHFGSLFGREFHRKSNDNDSFIQPVLNTSNVQMVSNDATPKVDSDKISKEMETKNNVSKENYEYHPIKRDEIKNVTQTTETMNKTEPINEENDAVTESIKINGDIIIENPTEATTLGRTEITTPNPVNNATEFRNFNVSIVTKYFNAKPMNPTVIFRSQDTNFSNETDANETKTLAVQEVTKSVQTTNLIANKSEIVNTDGKGTEDGLENEIEGIMDTYNSTSIPEEFAKYVKDFQMNSGENVKVREQMKEDLAKLLAPPSTQSTVTVMFTDPFDDIDDATDIL